MDKEALKRFLVESNEAGYAGGEEKKWIRESDGSWTIPFSKGEWRSHDNFFGGEPYGGRTVVFFGEKPVWMMVYYGWVAADQDAEKIYGILRAALRGMPTEHPYRGPQRHREGEHLYANQWQGELERFSGEETIHRGDALHYWAAYVGGLVDVRRVL
jgi:uncharacterized protein DUF5680